MIYFGKIIILLIMTISLPGAESGQIASGENVACTACIDVGCTMIGQTQCATISCGNTTTTCYTGLPGDSPDGTIINDTIVIARE